MSRFVQRHCSVRKSGDILKVKLECDGAVTFKGSAPLSNPEKVADLIHVLRSKGVAIPKESSSWW